MNMLSKTENGLKGGIHYLNAILLLFTTTKGVLTSIMVGVLSYFVPVTSIIMIIFIFVVVDLVSGISAARVKKEPVKSKKMRSTVQKMLCYMTTIVLAFFIQKEILIYEWFEIMNVVSGIIALAEFKSILENFGTITGNSTFKDVFGTLEAAFKKKNRRNDNNDENKFDDNIENFNNPS